MKKIGYWKRLFALLAVLITVIGQYGAVLASEKSPYIISDDPRVHGDLSFVKKDSISGAVIPGAEFLISGTSDYGNEISMTAESGDYGTVSFTNIEKGTYDLEETVVPEGYIAPQEPWKVSVGEEGIAALYQADGTTEADKDTDGRYVLTNEPFHSITFLKTSTYGDGIVTLSGAEFSLRGISDYGKDVDMTAVSDTDGYVSFSDLEPGTYQLQETKAPEDHELDTSIRTVAVNSDGTFTIDGLQKTKLTGSDAEIYDFKDEKTSGMVVITKQWEDDGDDSERPDIADVSITVSTKKPSISKK